MSSSGGGSNSPHKIFEFSLGDRSSPKYESLKKVLIYLSNEKLPIGFFPASSMKTPFFWTVFTDFKLLYALEKIGIDAFPMLKRAPCLLFTNILYNSEKPDFARFLNVLQKSPNNVTKFGDVDFKNENIDISELVKEISNQNEKCIKFQIPLSEWLENRRDLVIHEVLSIIPQNYNFQSRQIISPEKFYLMNFRDHKNNQISLSINNKKHILNVLYFVGFPLASKDERWKIFNEYVQLPLFSFQSIKTFTAAVLKRCIKYGKLNAVDENELDLILKQHKSYPDLSTLSQYDLQMNKRFFNESLFEGNDDISFIPNHIFQLLYKQLRFFDRIRVIFATRSFNVDKKTFPVWEMSPPFWQQAYDILLFKYVNQAGLTYLSNFAKCFKSYLSKESALVLDKLNVYERSCYPIPPIDIKDSSISRDLSFLRNLNEVTKRLETLCDYFEANSNEIMAVENIISKNNSNIATNRQNINSNNRQSNYNFNEISISNNASTTHNHNNNLIFSIPNEYLDKFNPNDIYNKQLEIIQMHQMINSKNFTPAEYSRIWQRPTTSDPFYLMFSNLIGRQSIKKTCLILSDVNKYPIGLDEQGLPEQEISNLYSLKIYHQDEGSLNKRSCFLTEDEYMKANEAANKGKQVKEYSQPNTDTTKNNTKDVTASTTQNPQQRTNSSLSNYNSSNIGAAIPNNPEKSPTNSQNSANLSNNSVSQDSPKPNQTVALTIKNLTIPTSPAPTSSVSNSPAPTSSVSNSSVSNSSVSNSSVPNSNSNVPNSSGNLSLTPNNQLGSLVSDKTSNDIANKGVKVNNYQPISTMKNQQQVKSGISATKTTATFSSSLKAPNFNSTISKPPTIHSSYVLTPKPGNKTTQVQNESTTAPKTTTTTTSSITPSQSSGKIVKRPLNQILNESEKRLLPTNSQPKPVSDFPPVKVTIPTTTNSNQSTNSNSCLSENNQNSTSATSMCVPLDGSQMRVQFLHESDPEKNKEVPLNLKSTTVAFIKDGESFQRIGYLNDFFFKFMLKVEFRQPNRPIFIISCEKGKNTNDFETIDEGKTTWSNPDIYVCFRLFKNGIKILKEDDQSYPMILEKTPFAFFNIPFALTSHQLVELLY